MVDRKTEPVGMESDLLSLARILVIRWWVIIVVILAVFVVTIASWSVQDDPDPVYESTTKLLLVAPVSDRDLALAVEEEGGVPVPGLSFDTILDLATATDLYQSIIDSLDLTNSEGSPISVADLDVLITSSVSQADEGGTLPLLTTTVQSPDPATTGQIARSWADIFAEKNGQLVALQAEGSFDLAVGQYDAGFEDVESVRGQLTTYLQSRVIEQLKIVETRGIDRVELVSDRRNKRQDLQDEDSRTVNNATDTEGGNVAPIISRDADLQRTVSSYDANVALLRTKNLDLVRALVNREDAISAFSSESPVITLNRGMSSEALVAFLATGPGAEQLTALDDLVFVDETKNDIYYELKARVIELNGLVSQLEMEISEITSNVDELKKQINTLKTTADRKAIDLSNFDDETTLLLQAFDDETTRLDSVFEDETKRESRRFDRVLADLNDDLDRLRTKVTDAKSARTDGFGSIRIVEEAITPTSPVAQPDSRSFARWMMMAAAIGLILGLVTAVLYHGILIAIAKTREDGIRN